jgi:hypothetical protein
MLKAAVVNIGTINIDEREGSDYSQAVKHKCLDGTFR